MEQNQHGQPVGAEIDWSPAERPSGTTLVGRTVRLEALAVDHAEQLFEAMRPAPDGHWTYMPWGPFESLDAYLRWAELSIEADNVEYMTICDLDGVAQGVAGYLNMVPAMGSIEVGGITYAPSLQRSVQATEAMYLMMAHAFDDLGYRRYEWKCDSLNAPSRAAAERLGFLYEGTFAQHYVVKGRSRDTAWFGITDHRWKSSVGPALRSWLSGDNFDAAGAQRRRLQDLR